MQRNKKRIRKEVQKVFDYHRSGLFIELSKLLLESSIGGGTLGADFLVVVKYPATPGFDVMYPEFV